MTATTPETELSSIDITTPDGACDSRLAKPAQEGKYPGVLFYMDAFGLRPVTDEWISRIAAQGYVVLAPNLFYRSARSPIVKDVQGMMTAENRPKLFAILGPLMNELTPGRLAEDSGTYVDFLTNLPQTGPGPIGITGYCLGARVALRTAAARPDRVGAVAGFHGGNLATEEPDSPHLLASKIAGEVYIAYADHDDHASPEQQARLDEALSSAGVRHESEVYKDAPHGYTMSDTAAYRKEAAERHFESLMELFDRTLK
jgi:carboxymethylenebutenolidase